MKLFLYIILLFGFSNCVTESITFKGNLYFKTVDVGSLYPMSDSQIDKKMKELKIQAKDVREIEQVYNFYEALREDSLINKPYFNLLLEDGRKIKLYTSLEQYAKLTRFNFNELGKKNKLYLEGQMGKSKNGFSIAYSLDSLKIVPGKTLRTK